MKKIWYSNGEIDILLPEEQPIPEGFVRGRKCLSKSMKGKTLSEETKNKIAQKALGRAPHNKGKKEEVKHVYYTDGITSIRVPEGTPCPDGFRRGRLKRKLDEEERKHFNDARCLTNLSRYGDKNYNNSEKSFQTKYERFGDGHYNNHEHSVQTNLSKYGVDNPSKLDSVKEKIVSNMMKTNMERYGVPYTVLLNPVGSTVDSKPNNYFNSLLEQLDLQQDVDYKREFSLGPYRYDFLVNRTLIEINPFPYHNSTWAPIGVSPKSSDYHYNKTQLALNNGYRCISIWDWDDTDKIVKLLSAREKLFARNCVIKEVAQKEASEYLDKWHLQGAVASTIYIGLYNNDALVSLMTFGKPRYNKNYEYELLRYCSSANIIGGAEKLFKHFISTYKPKSVLSYCDLSKFSGNVYEKLGFSLLRTTIGKHWYSPKLKMHITDNLLRQRGFDQLLGDKFGTFGKGTDNNELMLQHGFVEIYDCGQATYVWNGEQ